MQNSYPTQEQTLKLFEEVISIRNASPHPFRPEWERDFRKHCALVADTAKKIAAKTGRLDCQKAWTMGMLHDCGRLKDEFAELRFHGVIGYNWLLQKGYPEVAKISITHSFYEKDFDETRFTQPHEDILFCKQYLKTVTYDDYDLLLQLCDILNDMGKPCTIEYRFMSLAKRYGNDRYYENIPLLNHIKKYFEDKCQCSLYELIGVENELSKSRAG